MSIHDGHRQRMKERFYADGLDGLNKHEILEMLLYYCIPRRNTNEIAHYLLKEFKTLPRVLNASVKELEGVEGVGHNAAVFINFVRQLDRYFRDDDSDTENILDCMDKYYRYLRKSFAARKNETVMLLCLDAKCKVLGCPVIAEGNVNSVSISIRKIVDTALATNATSVILAHNHPSGLAVPSIEDILTTKRVAKALQMIDVVLNDHVVIADGVCVSLLNSRGYNDSEDFEDGHTV